MSGRRRRRGGEDIWRGRRVVGGVVVVVFSSQKELFSRRKYFCPVVNGFDGKDRSGIRNCDSTGHGAGIKLIERINEYKL